MAERLTRPAEEGAIDGYHAAVWPPGLGYTLGVVRRILPAPRQLRRRGASDAGNAEMIECHRITGDDRYIMTA